MRFLEKLKESVVSILPISVLVLILMFSFGGFEGRDYGFFIVAVLMVLLGMSLFSLGADLSMISIGENIGSKLLSSPAEKGAKAAKLALLIVVALTMGIATTLAEPDLWVLAGQLKNAISEFLIIIVVASGVGIFLMISVLRLVFNLDLQKILVISYFIIIALAIGLAFKSPSFIPIAFDSGAVTTGPITVPFFMAFGIGLATVKDSSSAEDNFGMLALCSTGPIISILILGLISNEPMLTVTSSAFTFVDILVEQLINVAIALVPILFFFFIFQIASLRLKKKAISKILMGIFYTYLGLVIFLTGVSFGFLETGASLGEKIVLSGHKFALIPIGILVGFFLVIAEPAVLILTGKIEEITAGTIKKKSILFSLMIAVALAVGLAMVRVLTGISVLWFIVPGYAAAIVISFFVPKVYTAIAFDSGGVASGSMAASFLLPLATGASKALGGNIIADSFGVVAMIAMMPLITLQLLGLYSAIKIKKAEKALAPVGAPALPEPEPAMELVEIIEFDWEE